MPRGAALQLPVLRGAVRKVPVPIEGISDTPLLRGVISECWVPWLPTDEVSRYGTLEVATPDSSLFLQNRKVLMLPYLTVSHYVREHVLMPRYKNTSMMYIPGLVTFYQMLWQLAHW